jgi:predicted esterase
MKKIFQSCLIFFIFVAGQASLSPFPLSQNNGQYELHPIQTPINIDGCLDEWSSSPSLLINRTPQGDTVRLSLDISVLASFAYDREFFYAALTVQDDTFEFSRRGWRYGDGFYLTFVRNAQGKADSQFYSYGFAFTGQGLEKILVNRDGTYFPPLKTKEIKFALQKNQATNIITYEVAIPWKYLAPFKPLIHRSLGINLIYVDRDGQERTILQLLPDPDYDTELSTKRRGAPFECLIKPPPGEEKLEGQTALSSTHAFSYQDLEVQFGLNSSQKTKNCLLRTIIYQGNSPLQQVETRQTLNQGLNLIGQRLPLKGIKTGEYVVVHEVYHQEDKLPLITQENIFVINQDWFARLKSNLEKFAQNSPSSPQYQASISVAEIRCEWIEHFMKTATSHAPINKLATWIEELVFLHDKLSRGKPALFDTPGIHRYAHRSHLDGTLQPYSFYWPPSYNPQKNLPLLVVLHGSGVDEAGIINYYSKLFPEWPILAPQARGLSDWYLGSSGEDVLECLAHARQLFSLDENSTFLVGFSMGGYGVWRIGLLHPEKFRGLIIISGDFQPPAYKKGENMINCLHKAQGKPILIIHGTKDKAIPITNIYPGLEKLRSLNIPFDYWEIKDAGHGNFKPELWEKVKAWIKQKINYLP